MAGNAQGAPNLNIPATHASASTVCRPFGANFIHETNRLTVRRCTRGNAISGFGRRIVPKSHGTRLKKHRSETDVNTLTTTPLAPLLERLFEEAATSGSSAASIGGADRARLFNSKTEYLDLYGRMKDLWLPVSEKTGTLLYMLARGSGARSIVEFGTSFGISTLHLAAALRDNGGGRLITTEFEPSKVARARQHIEAGGLADLVEIREGDALKTLAADLPQAIDLVLLDGAKAIYPEVLGLLEPRLKPGAIVVADNADMCPEYLQRVRDPAQGYLSLPFDEDVELSVWVGRG